MTEWIEINLPWNVSDPCPNLCAPYPNLDDRVRAYFGYTQESLAKELFPGLVEYEDLLIHPLWQEYEQIREDILYSNETAYVHDPEQDQEDKWTAILQNNAVMTVVEYLQRIKEIDAWIDEQPEIIAWHQENDRLWAEHGEKQANKSFCGRNLNRPGVLIEFEENGQRFKHLIGEINQLGGVCDDCRAFGDETIILRYRVIWDGDYGLSTEQKA